MNIADILTDDIVAYLRIDNPSNDDIKLVEQMSEAAVEYICGYTGQSEKAVREKTVFVPVYYILIADMYDNRQLSATPGAGENPVVKTILGMYSINLL